MWKWGIRRAIVLLLVLVSLMAVVNVAFADEIDPDPTTGDPGIPADKRGFQKLIGLAQKVFNFLMAAGGMWVVAALALNGWKLASPNGKTRAEGMDGLKYAIIGAFVAFGSFIIASWLRGLVVGL